MSDVASVKIGASVDTASIKDAISKIKTTIKSSTSGISSSISSGFKGASGGIKQVLGHIKNTVKSNFKSIQSNVKASVNKVRTNISEGFKGARNHIRTSMKRAEEDVKKSTSGMSSMFKKLGGVLAGAFAVGKIVQFSKAMIESYTGSIEQGLKLQTIMKQRFNATQAEVNAVGELADSIEQLGVVDKDVILAGGQQAATFLTQKESLEALMPAMGNLIAQQKGFNATESDAVTIGNLMGKVMQGQTSALKKVGISFTEAEEQVLKYGTELERANMLAQVINNNVGDMNQTLGNTPIGQMTRFGYAMDGIKDSIGRLLTAAITPLLGALTSIVNVLADAISNAAKFVETLFGVNNGALAGIGSTITEVSEATEEVVDNVSGSAKSAVKEVKGAIGGFDELTTLNKSDSGDVSGVTSGTVTTISKGTSEATKSSKGLKGELNGVLEVLKECGEAFKNGFTTPFKNVDFSSIKSDIVGIKDSTVEIFKGVSGQIQSVLVSASGALGSVLGNIGLVGLGIGEAILGGTNNYLENNKASLIQRINSLLADVETSLNNISGITDIIGELLYNFVSSDEMKGAVENCIGIITELFLTPKELLMSAIADGSTLILGMLTALQPQLDTALSNIAGLFESVTSLVKDIITDVGDTMKRVYSEYIKPAMENFVGGFQKVASAALDFYNNYLAPTIDNVINILKEVWDKSIKPLVDKIGNVIGKIVLLLGVLWNNVLAPLVSWVIDTFGPGFSAAIEEVAKVFKSVVDNISKIIGGLLDSLQGILDFLIGVFTGDWKRAWQGLSDFVTGLWKSLTGVLKAPFNFMIDAINTIIGAINKLSFDVPDWVPGIGGTTFGFNIPKIPKLADGGIVSRATQFIAGEAGAEAVVPLQNSQFIKDFANEIAEQIGISGSAKEAMSIQIGTLIQDDRGYEWLVDVIEGIMARREVLA